MLNEQRETKGRVVVVDLAVVGGDLVVVVLLVVVVTLVVVVDLVVEVDFEGVLVVVVDCKIVGVDFKEVEVTDELLAT